MRQRARQRAPQFATARVRGGTLTGVRPHPTLPPVACAVRRWGSTMAAFFAIILTTAVNGGSPDLVASKPVHFGPTVQGAAPRASAIENKAAAARPRTGVGPAGGGRAPAGGRERAGARPAGWGGAPDDTKLGEPPGLATAGAPRRGYRAARPPIGAGAGGSGSTTRGSGATARPAAADRSPDRSADSPGYQLLEQEWRGYTPTSPYTDRSGPNGASFSGSRGY